MSEPFIGQIQAFGFNFAPRGWAKCDGQLLSISSNSALFSLLGTMYGGDGRTTFGLPDLRGRVIIHHGTGPGLTSRTQGARAGNETTILTEANLPAHNHNVRATARCVTTAGDTNVAVDNVWSKDAGVSAATYSTSAPDADMENDAILVQQDNIGTGTGHTNMQPYLVLNYCIALVGLFPSRN
ncbi:tail fiber protein [Thalassomonas sp. RHCl1]|uniref:phage tail protein n=1 Tax=Thalassomonas sp. RHCl1 TaxID=2995320 RepID=UPI00248A9307|nr:tail fiber protein [Thalassomonas sp. RHCl1]